MILKKKKTNKYTKLTKKYRIKRLKKTFKRKHYILNKKFKKIFEKVFVKQQIEYKINIKIIPNNIFCILTKNIDNKTISITSAGKLKLKVTKRKLKYVSAFLIKEFIKQIKPTVAKKTSLLVLSAPIKLRKKILKQLIMGMKNTRLIINIPDKKCFNGCRPKKQRKKKRKGLRIRK